MCSWWKLHFLNVVKSGVITGIGDHSASLPLVLEINSFLCIQVQTEEMQAGVQEELSCGENR